MFYVATLMFCIVGSVSCGQDMLSVDNKVLLEKQCKYVGQDGNFEYVTFYSQHGPDSVKKIARNGILLTKPHAQATILICHGFMCDKFDSGFLRTLLFSNNYNVMTFDFRAHGEAIDEQQCCTFGRDEAYDVIAAAQYLKARPDTNNVPLVAYGFSMGAVAAIQAQSTDKNLFAAMILDCPYDKSENIIKKGIEKLKFNFFGYTFSLPGRGLLEKYAFHPYVQSLLKSILKTVANMDATATNTYIYPLSPAETVKTVSVPCFFIHCINDEKVTVDAAKNLFNGAAGYKRLWLTQGRRHFDSFFYNPEKYAYKVQKFITAVIDGSLRYKIQQKIVHDLPESNQEVNYV